MFPLMFIFAVIYAVMNFGIPLLREHRSERAERRVSNRGEVDGEDGQVLEEGAAGGWTWSWGKR